MLHFRESQRKSKLLRLAHRGDWQAFELACDASVGLPQLLDIQNNNVLQISAINGHLEFVRQLITLLLERNPADLKEMIAHKNLNNITALDGAYFRGSISKDHIHAKQAIATLLVAQGAIAVKYADPIAQDDKTLAELSLSSPHTPR